MRSDGARGGPKYSYLSSTKYGGPGPGTPPHFPLGITAPVEILRLTEGPLKADIAYARSGLPTISAPSLATWRKALDLLPAFGCKTVRLAFDADALDNPHVARALSECCEAAVAFSLAVELERWDAVDGKGIDDLLAAGKSPELLVGEAALAAIREALAAAAAGEPPAAPGGLEHMVELLANSSAVALFRNREMLTELARLKKSDPAAFAACRATLKGQVSLNDLDAALKPFLLDHARERPPTILGEAGYRIQDGRLCREHSTRDGGSALTPLCDFTACITETVVRDDGAEQTAVFTIAGTLANGRELPPVQVPADDFGGMGWVTGAWHGQAIVYAGQGTKDHLRVAIELLSRDRVRTVFAHTGWRQVGDVWHYLHAAGAIGPNGNTLRCRCITA